MMLSRKDIALRAWRVCVQAAIKGAPLLLLIAASLGAYCGLLRYTGNVHAVEEGRLYRSAQLQGHQLEQVIAKYRIRSILNVRGASPGQSWYDDEIVVAKNLHVAHFDYGLSASDPLSAGQVDEVLELIQKAPRPILIHCQSGADRAGLVSALFLAVVAKKPINEAIGQLSLLYGHFPYFTSRTRAMDESFWVYINADPDLQGM
jgi:protein tyrosine/serine phosphatase